MRRADVPEITESRQKPFSAGGAGLWSESCATLECTQVEHGTPERGGSRRMKMGDISWNGVFALGVERSRGDLFYLYLEEWCSVLLLFWCRRKSVFTNYFHGV
jgi:hypothetical protein